MIDKSQNKADVMEMRRLFYDKYNGKITQSELDEKLQAIMDRQAELPLKEEI